MAHWLAVSVMIGSVAASLGACGLSVSAASGTSAARSTTTSVATTLYPYTPPTTQLPPGATGPCRAGLVIVIEKGNPVLGTCLQVGARLLLRAGPHAGLQPPWSRWTGSRWTGSSARGQALVETSLTNTPPVLLARFLARKPGTVRITTEVTPACSFYKYPCGEPDWTITLTVRVVPGHATESLTELYSSARAAAGQF